MEKQLYRFLIVFLAVVGVVLTPQYAVCQRNRDRSKDKDNDSLRQMVVDYTLSDSDRERVRSGVKLAQFYLDDNDPRCVDQAEATIKIADKNKMYAEEGELYNILGVYYYNKKEYKKSASKLESGYTILKKNNLAIPRTRLCYSLGRSYQQLKNNRKAQKYFDESMTLAKKLGDKEMMHTLTRSLCDIMLSDKNYKMAYEYLNAYLQEENDKLNNKNTQLNALTNEQEQLIDQKDSTIQVVVNKSDSLELVKQKLENERMALEIENLRKKDSLQRVESEKASLEAENNFQTKMMWFLVVLALFATGFLIYVCYNIRQKKRANKALQEKNNMIESQKDEIERQKNEISKNLDTIALKNKDITDSLTYAGTIQKAMLRDFERHRSLMSDYFIFYVPKDIVSGDFYWAYKVGSKFVFTVGDCTGHSVPGAFMSMLGIALLNQIVAQQHVLQASKILEEMRVMVKQYLGQSGMDEAPKDGMDMALCVWNLEDNNCNFAGAYNPMLMVRDGEIKVLDAVKSPVGVHMRELPFEDQYVQLQKGDRLFLFSDGYSDQFSSSKNDKFKMSRFRQLLLESSSLSMAGQRDKIVETYYAWKGDFMQIDDVCVLGVEI